MTARYTVFEGSDFLVNGPLKTIVREMNAQLQSHPAASMLVFDDETGRQTDVDLRDPAGQSQAESPARGKERGKGRPKLGVVSREVTLLPRHWDWLRAQRGGASAALRTLVDQARHFDRAGDAIQRAQNAAYAFMSAMAGNLPGYEDATRALFAPDETGFAEHTAQWPEDIRRYASDLAASAFIETSRCLE